MFELSGRRQKDEHGDCTSESGYLQPKAVILPRGSIDTTIMELGPQNHDKNSLLGPKLHNRCMCGLSGLGRSTPSRKFDPEA